MLKSATQGTCLKSKAEMWLTNGGFTKSETGENRVMLWKITGSFGNRFNIVKVKVL